MRVPRLDIHQHVNNLDMSELVGPPPNSKEGSAIVPPSVVQSVHEKIEESREEETQAGESSAPEGLDKGQRDIMESKTLEVQPRGLAQPVITVPKLTEMVLVNIVAGRLKVLPRLITILGNSLLAQ